MAPTGRRRRRTCPTGIRAVPHPAAASAPTLALRRCGKNRFSTLARGTRMDNARIYIVEDSSIIRENLIEALHENAPVEVVGTADDEKSAVAWLRDRSHASDLVIVDIFLKSGSGL